MMKWVLIAVGSLVAMVAVIWIGGSFLPKAHTVSRRLRLKQTPSAVWQSITDYSAMASWRKDVQSIDRLPDRNGHPVWQETLRDGSKLPLETTESLAETRLVREIADPDLPFGGNWTYELAPSGAETILTITENGEVRPPIFRVVSRFMNQAATIEGLLTALARKFGEEPRFY